MIEHTATIDYDISPEVPRAAPPAKVTGRDVLDAITGVGDELADRDDELREVLGQLGGLYRKLHDELADRRRPLGTESLELQLQVLVRSVDNLTAADTVASERVANLSTAVDRLAGAVTSLTTRLGNLERRFEVVEEALLGAGEAIPADAPVVADEIVVP